MSKRRPRPSRHRHRGFTLLEIMITLVVFATLAAAVLAAGQYALKQNARLEEQLCGVWLADNHLSELQLGAVPATAGAQLNRHFAGRDWTVSQVISPAREPGLLAVQLSVSPADSARDVHRTSGWIDAREP
ncbi:general secretion pathway protein I [Pseudomonas sp. ok272]|uniref:type II secretion system minor pseudopilin GspI n=1 Tax=unclassified Pseudomonas TaxID=196821 RepID=UPI0008B5BF9E|nr:MULTISPECIES: type II secretion system minor pseudopilin GspI [unclassified Pseudomonas]SEN33958.1 general secretion pathway protein I [Pseudomonas sp. ok272]SFM84747.1 general secretion pathway protein I [Pseudomonas sp. ok602]